MLGLNRPLCSILDGRPLAKLILQSVKEDFLRLGTVAVPRLDIVKGSSDPATAVYIRHKLAAIRELGFECVVHEPATTRELVSLAGRLNDDRRVHAIIIQLPVRLDAPIESALVYSLVKPWKDVDGLNPVNMGVLAMSEASPYFYPATPAAVVEMLRHYGVEVHGKRVCIIGRSAIVGRPLLHMMMRMNATVTACHSQTSDLPSVVRQADIVVVAAGRPRLIKADWVRHGAVVIDVGINEVLDPATSRRRLVGDVDFEGVRQVAAALTPVPGGIGPLTVAMLMRNVLRAFELNCGQGDQERS